MLSHILLQRLSSMPLLSDMALTAADTLFIRQQLPQGTFVVSAGEISDQVFFIEQGLARAFYQYGQEEITAWIAAESDFMYSVYSYINRKPSFETIELLEDSVILSATRTDLDAFYSRFPEANRLSQFLTEQYLLRYDERIRAFHMLTAEERLRRFEQEFPHLYRRTPLQYVASYFGMSQSHLSRIRAKKQ